MFYLFTQPTTREDLIVEAPTRRAAKSFVERHQRDQWLCNTRGSSSPRHRFGMVVDKTRFYLSFQIRYSNGFILYGHSLVEQS